MAVDGGRRRWVCGLAGWVLVGAAQGAESGVLRFAVGDSWAPPYIEISRGRPTGGLMFELMEAIAAGAGLRAEYRRLPAQRVDQALASGEVDLHCLISPKWYEHPPAADRLGPPMVVLDDVLVAPPDSPPQDLKQHGLRVGTVLGYRYADLEPLFAAGRLRREDAPSQAKVLEKLSRGRSDVAVVDRLVLAHFNRGMPAAQRLVAQRLLSQTVTHCLFGARTDLPVERVRAALEGMVARGEVRRLMARYR